MELCFNICEGLVEVRIMVSLFILRPLIRRCFLTLRIIHQHLIIKLQFLRVIFETYFFIYVFKFYLQIRYNYQSINKLIIL